MKIEINKYLRVSLLCVMSFLVIIIGLLLYKTLMNPVFQEKKVSLYSYKNISNVEYKVSLKPNILYTGVMDEGKSYISAFVNQIPVVFKYEFTGDTTADLTGTYEIAAVMEGFISNEEGTSKTIWEKQFSLMPKASFQAKNKNFSLVKQVVLNFHQYNNFARQVLKDSELNSQVRMLVFMKVLLKGKTDKGLFEKELSPSIVIPLNTKYFEIEKSKTGEKSGTIKETRKVQMPVNKGTVAVYGILLTVILIGLLFLVFFTSGVVETNQLMKNLNKIFKQHGNRLVALKGQTAAEFDNCYKVRTIDDLVRVADELGKPVLYNYNSDVKQINTFFVCDNEYVYVLDLKDNVNSCKTEVLLDNEININTSV